MFLTSKIQSAVFLFSDITGSNNQIYSLHLYSEGSDCTGPFLQAVIRCDVYSGFHHHVTPFQPPILQFEM